MHAERARAGQGRRGGGGGAEREWRVLCRLLGRGPLCRLQGRAGRAAAAPQGLRHTWQRAPVSACQTCACQTWAAPSLLQVPVAPAPAHKLVPFVVVFPPRCGVAGVGAACPPPHVAVAPCPMQLQGCECLQFRPLVPDVTRADPVCAPGGVGLQRRRSGQRCHQHPTANFDLCQVAGPLALAGRSSGSLTKPPAYALCSR